ncbi:MAG TPA: hypothetical protein VGN12_28560 [Pirellulales bacterium]|jgi:hypothetical protein
MINRNPGSRRMPARAFFFTTLRRAPFLPSAEIAIGRSLKDALSAKPGEVSCLRIICPVPAKFFETLDFPSEY